MNVCSGQDFGVGGRESQLGLRASSSESAERDGRSKQRECRCSRTGEGMSVQLSNKEPTGMRSPEIEHG